MAANYGGRWDITQACQVLAGKVSDGLIQPSDINEELINSHLSTHELPELDLMIRTGGECRISNFMLWQLAYAEFYFSDLYWPDFKKEQMLEALSAFALRRRRFGQTDDQLDNADNS